MSGTSQRCMVCNELTYTNSVYCSSQCQEESDRLFDEIANDIDNREEEPGFFEQLGELDEYYAPYKKEWLE